jgi:hypothetical protein
MSASLREPRRALGGSESLAVARAPMSYRRQALVTGTYAPLSGWSFLHLFGFKQATNLDGAPVRVRPGAPPEVSPVQGLIPRGFRPVPDRPRL